MLYGVVDSPRLPGDVFTPSRKKGSKLYDPSSPRGPTAGQMLVPIKWPDSTLGRQPPRTPRTPKGKPVGNSAQIMSFGAALVREHYRQEPFPPQSPRQLIPRITHVSAAEEPPPTTTRMPPHYVPMKPEAPFGKYGALQMDDQDRSLIGSFFAPIEASISPSTFKVTLSNVLDI